MVLCSTHSCEKTCVVLCICCQDYFCIDHIKQHSKLFNNKLTLIDNEINELFNELNNITYRQSIYLKKLDRWRIDAHQLINEFFERKKREVEEFVCTEQKEQTTKINQFRDQVNELIQNRKVTDDEIISINNTIQSFKKVINQFEFLKSPLPPLIIDEHVVDIHEENSKLANFSSLSPPQRTIKLKEPLYTIAAGNRHLLVFQDNNLCLLNRKLIITKKISWNRNDLYDIDWSRTLSRFILVTSQKIFILDFNRLSMENFPIDQNSIISDWLCVTCLDDKLFLSTRIRASSIYEYSLLPSIEFVKEYNSPISCKKDEVIMDLSSNSNGLILITTKNLQNEVRIDLCSSVTFERYWTNKLGILSGRYRIRSCLLPNEQWMVINRNKSELFYISSDGHLLKHESYNSSISYAVLLENDLLAILTRESINLHKLS